MGHCLVMGRRTYELLAGRTLPGRRIIVLSRQIHPEIIASGSMTARSLDEAIDLARSQLRESEAFIAGGAQVYGEALGRDLVDRMYLTRNRWQPAHRRDLPKVRHRQLEPSRRRTSWQQL